MALRSASRALFSFGRGIRLPSSNGVLKDLHFLVNSFVDTYKSKYQFHVHYYNLTKVPELAGMRLSEPHLILGATRTVLVRRRYFSGG